ncbi:acetyl-CoA carboxylase family protein [Leptospira neocaledonica]|uniref:Carbamoyl-phosphate synthase large subunit n=1 Tax=Leptospira neocaledonica TaxID=2023192 RepID=A0A2M9ZTT2_9LEPT|nr:carboxyl transferase domain-containing protein [Leptospira neocaledonica]PJZ75379.1 carbamoyl-phosphate synthase large subunit [Leptospira neocaledonica]
MKLSKLLIANRGEVAIRIARAASSLGVPTVSIYSEDDSNSRHRLVTDVSVPLKGRGAKAYLDQEEILSIARGEGCDSIHPGYGFLSENFTFAKRCEDSKMNFVGPDPKTLEILGDKLKAVLLAESLEVPTLPGLRKVIDLKEAKEFYSKNGIFLLKAIAGGGGRGIRIINSAEELENKFKHCAEEALHSFGNPNLYAEKYLPTARHVEVQILGDGSGNILHFWERDCSLQRKNQKLLEIAPAPFLDPKIREKIISYSLLMASHLSYKSLGTFEFLISPGSEIYFIESNPRLQVEHTITEEITGVDLVEAQLEIASGKSLQEIGLDQKNIESPKGYAIQIRINSETWDQKGEIIPSSGKIKVFEPSSGPGIRVDSSAYSGYEVGPNFDSLLAKLIVHSKHIKFSKLIHFAYRALSEFRVEGIKTNLPILLNLFKRKELETYEVWTKFIEENIEELLSPSITEHKKYNFEIPKNDNLENYKIKEEVPDGLSSFHSPMTGSLVEIYPKEGDPIRKGEKVALLSSMKMEHLLHSEITGIIERVLIEPGKVISEGEALVWIRSQDLEHPSLNHSEDIDPDYIRPDLQEVLDRLILNEDISRPQAVSKRHKRGQRTARENVADLCDLGSFVEYGSLAIAAQRRRRSLEELIKLSPADGLIAGLGTVNGELFDSHLARVSVLAYDYTVFMGTQGAMNHKKTDRFLEMVESQKLPLVFFTEGGGGRPGEVDMPAVAGLDLHTFRKYAGLKGKSLRVAIASGRCFAGNAALFGASDIRIATEDSNIGMGGPVMVKGGGLGNFSAEEIGPSETQTKNGVIDILVKNEEEAIRTAKKVLSYFQGYIKKIEYKDQKILRTLIPENRLRSYEIRSIISSLADTDSVLEFKKDFAKGIVTSLIRIEGRPLGLIANNPTHLGGAIDAEGAEKASEFAEFCDLNKLPILFLCDTPGFMVGPEVEKKGLVRKAAKFFEAGASLQVPVFTIILRKGYGLGAMAMAAGSFHSPVFTISWPTGEFGAMGIEGEIRTGYQKELAEVKDWKERQILFERLVAEAYERGKAINMASYLEIDAVIDPAESRKWILRGYDSCI